jgi:hypothetical protein
MDTPPFGEPAVKRKRWEDCRKIVASRAEAQRNTLHICFAMLPISISRAATF